MKATVVRMDGEVDLASRPMLTRIAALVRNSQIVVLDMARLKYADTTLLRFLIGMKKDGLDVRLVGLSGHCRRVFEVTGLASQFRTYEHAADATYDAGSVEWLIPQRAIA